MFSGFGGIKNEGIMQKRKKKHQAPGL